MVVLFSSVHRVDLVDAHNRSVFYVRELRARSTSRPRSRPTGRGNVLFELVIYINDFGLVCLCYGKS